MRGSPSDGMVEAEHSVVDLEGEELDFDSGSASNELGALGSVSRLLFWPEKEKRTIVLTLSTSQALAEQHKLLPSPKPVTHLPEQGQPAPGSGDASWVCPHI